MKRLNFTYRSGSSGNLPGKRPLPRPKQAFRVHPKCVFRRSAIEQAARVLLELVTLSVIMLLVATVLFVALLS